MASRYAGQVCNDADRVMVVGGLIDGCSPTDDLRNLSRVAKRPVQRQGATHRVCADGPAFVEEAVLFGGGVEGVEMVIDTEGGLAFLERSPKSG